MDRPAVAAAAAGLVLAPAVGFLATRAPMLALAGALALALGTVLFLRPRLGAYLLVGTMFFNEVDTNVGFGFIGVGDVACMAVAPTWLLYRLAHARGLRLPAHWWLLALFLGLCFASMMFGVTPSRAYANYLRTVTYVVGALVLIDLGRDERFLRQALWVMAFAGLVHALAALPEVPTGQRVEGLPEQANILATVLGASAFATMGLLEDERRRRWRAAMMGGVALMVFVLMHTISRTNYVALAVTLLWWARRSPLRLHLGLALLAGAVWFAVGPGRATLERIERRINLQDGRSALNRLETADNAIEVMMRRPLLGVGFGQFVELDKAMDLTKQKDRSAHSLYLGTAAEAGLPAGLALIAFLGLIARRIWRLGREAIALGPPARSVDRVVRAYQGMFLFTAIGWISQEGGKTRFWILVGLLCAASMLALPRREPDERPT